MVRIVVAVAGAALLVACGKTSSAPLPSPDKKAPVMTCEELFAAPAGGELLCDEHVVPTSGLKDEIHWRSYGLPEDRGLYCERYRDAAHACNFGFTFKPPACDVSDHKGRRAALFFKTPESVGGADYPRCARAPDAKHKTVVVISERASP
jgi:hypothetical protein